MTALVAMETIKKYVAKGEDVTNLVAIPLAISGWFRYLLAVNDKGEAMPCSADPLLEEMQTALAGIQVGNPDSYQGQLQGILCNKNIFGSDLVENGLAAKIEVMFQEMLAGPSAVRNTLEKYLGNV